MADEPESKEPKPEAEAKPEQPPKQSKPTMLFAIVGAGSFVAFVVIFSLLFGVFSAPQPDPSALGTADSTLQGDSVLAPEDVEDSLPPALPWQFGLDAEDAEAFDSAADSTTAFDSLGQVAWYEQQKREIAAERTQLETDKVQLEQLKVEVNQLLEMKRSMEQGKAIETAKLFDGMKPDEVASIMANMPDSQVTVVLQRMKKANASKVIAKLPADRAARITLQIMAITGEQ